MILNRNKLGQLKPKSYHPADIERPSENIIIGDSIAAHSLRQMAALAAASDGPVLLTGPSGSGKTVTARAVHAASAQRNRPFVTVNCSTLSSDDAVLSVFGINAAYVYNPLNNGSMFAQAAGGTLYLDEIADLPADAQAILEKLIEGADIPGMQKRRNQKDYVRIIASTSQCLASLIGEDMFRQDLFYSLSLLTIPVPPLRQRRDDIAGLIDYFLMDRPSADHFTLERAAQQILEAHYWPGNIRELRNLVARSCLFYPGGPISASRMAALLNMGQPSRHAAVTIEQKSNSVAIEPGFNLKAYLDDEEMRYIQTALTQSKGIVQHAADLSGIKRTTFIEKMKRHGINVDEYKK
jgi:sigma-54 dependent transcriptional regulator, flagellar regulatory protein